METISEDQFSLNVHHVDNGFASIRRVVPHFPRRRVPRRPVLLCRERQGLLYGAAAVHSDGRHLILLWIINFCTAVGPGLPAGTLGHGGADC